MSEQLLNIQGQGQRVARNTLVLFLRIFILTLVNLYVVRLLLNELGVEDYGIFQAVAGLIMLLSCFSSVLSVSTQRFYSFLSGEGRVQELSNVFSASFNLNFIFAVLIVFLFETIGLWFLNTQMNIPYNRLSAANWLFHCSVASFSCMILQIPFLSALVAHEDMSLFALLSGGECFARLGVVLLLFLAEDKLLMSGVGFFLVSLSVFCGYVFVARKRYAECCYKHVHDRSLYCKLLSFSGWTFFGTLAGVCMFQGNNLLLNLFFGPMINAAYGISFQINNAFNSLCNSVVLAFRPMMTRTAANQDYEHLRVMFYISSKFIFYLLLVIAVPLFVCMPLVLRLWLGRDLLTSEMILFSRLTIVYIVIMALHNPITIVMQALGYVRYYYLSVESITLLCLPLSYIAFLLNAPSYFSYLSMIGVMLVAHFSRLFCMRRYCEWFSFSQYFIELGTGIGFRRCEREYLLCLMRGFFHRTK